MTILKNNKLTYKQLNTYLKDFIANIDTKFVTHINNNMQICINKKLINKFDKKISHIGNGSIKTLLDTSVVYTINTGGK